MAQLLPLVLAALAGFALVLTLTALWSSLRLVLAAGSMQAGASQDAANEPAHVRARKALVQEKDALLQAIRDVRFEHDLGKISDADAQRLEAQYRARAREVLAELDAQLAPHRARARALLNVEPQAAQPAGEA